MNQSLAFSDSESKYVGNQCTHFPSPALPGSGIVGMISARNIKRHPS